MNTEQAINAENTRNYGPTCSEILEIVRTMPGVTAKEVKDLMPHRSSSSVSSGLSKLYKLGAVACSEKVKRIKANGIPYYEAKYVLGDGTLPQYKLTNGGGNVSSKPLNNKKFGGAGRGKRQTDSGMQATIDALRAEVIELKQWKTDAIERFPELAVPPIMMRARKLVAKELEAAGDRNLAMQVMAGTKDGTLMVRVAVAALEEGD